MKIATFIIFVALAFASVSARQGDVLIYQLRKSFTNARINLKEIEKLKKREIAADQALEQGGENIDWVTSGQIVKALCSPQKGGGRVVVFVGVDFLQDKDIPPFVGDLLHIVVVAEFDSHGTFVRALSFPVEFSQIYPAKQIAEVMIKEGDGKKRVEFREGEKSEGLFYAVSGRLDEWDIDVGIESDVGEK
jgi:hypothetical protein